MPSKRIPIPFTGQHTRGKNVFLNGEESINYYPEVLNNKIVLRGVPGKTEFADLVTNQAVRAGIKSNGFSWWVSRDTLFKVDSSGNMTAVSGSMDLTESVFMIENSLSIGIFGGPKGYVYTHSTGALAQITDSDFPGASSATYQDGYAIVSRPGTAQLFVSDLNDFTSWDALEFTTAGWKPDNLLRVFSDHRDLLTLGETSTQIYYNAGSGTPVFSNTEGAELEIGIAAASSVAKGNNAVFWLANDEQGNNNVIAMVGRQPQIISTDSMAESIGGYSKISDAIGFTYFQDSHLFYEITFPAGNETFVYDSSLSLWHKRSSRVGNNDIRHRANCNVFLSGKHLVGDYADGKIYETSRTVYDEAGADLISTRTSQSLSNNQDLLTFNEIQILFGPGTGIVTGNSEDMDPKALLSWSDDGGKTFGNELELSIGKIGEFKNRAIEYVLGQGRNRVFKVKVTAAVERDIFDAFAMIEVDNA